MPGVTSLDELRRAIDDVDVDELTVEAARPALDAARASLDQSGLLLLGEVHGVRENALIIRALMRMLDVDGLGLEWDEDLTPVVASFASGAPLSDHPFLWTGDGRITAGHLALLRILKAEGRPPPRLVDGPIDAGAGWSRRDRLMADRVLASAADGPRLVAAGGLHTRMGRTRWGVPMGSRLRRAFPGVRAIRIVYRGGRYYNLAPREFPGRRRPRQPPPRDAPLLHERRGQLLLDLPLATEAVVPHRPLPRAPGSPLAGLIRLDDLPVRAERAAHVDPHRVAAMLPIFDSLPPITVFETPEGLLVADGHHRIAAAHRLGRQWISVEIRRGTAHDALTFAVENARRERGLSADQAREAIDRWSRRG